MAWSFVVSAATALAGVMGLGGLRYAFQEPNFDFDLATPQFTQASMQIGPTPPMAFNEKRVSLHFHNAKVEDVLGWLEKQNVSFIVKDSDVKGITVTMNIEDQPIEKVLSALGSTMGGHWERHGDIRVFSKGSMTFGEYLTPGQNDAYFSVPRGGALTLPATPFMPKVDTFGSKPFQNQLGLGPGQTFGTRSYMFSLGRQDIEGLMKSLTNDQKALEKKQGFLKFSDLTPAQQKMLNIGNSKGHFEFDYVQKDGKSIKIQSDN